MSREKLWLSLVALLLSAVVKAQSPRRAKEASATSIRLATSHAEAFFDRRTGRLIGLSELTAKRRLVTGVTDRYNMIFDPSSGVSVTDLPLTQDHYRGIPRAARMRDAMQAYPQYARQYRQ